MRSKRLNIALEFLILFFGLPLLLLFIGNVIYPSVILLPALVVVGLLLKFKTDVKAGDLIRLQISKDILCKHGIIVLLSGLIMWLGIWLIVPENLFNLPKGNFKIWIVFCIVYPVFSAYLQEIIFRTFIFKRYELLFRNKALLITASAVAFSFVHILYYNPLSIVLTLIAGFYLAVIYSETQSVLFTAIVHGILGNLAFTLGLGQYFWLDMLRWL